MKYLNEMKVTGHTIPIIKYGGYVYQQRECQTCGHVDNYEEHETECKVMGCKSKMLIPHEAYVMGAYNPQHCQIKLNSSEEEHVVGVNLVHETIEAINSICDIQMDHTQISVLGTALYQAFATGEVDFTPAATGLRKATHQQDRIAVAA